MDAITQPAPNTDASIDRLEIVWEAGRAAGMDPTASTPGAAAARLEHVLFGDAHNRIERIVYAAALLNEHRTDEVLGELGDDARAMYFELFSDTDLVDTYSCDFPFPAYCTAIVSDHLGRAGARRPNLSFDRAVEERARRTWVRLNNVTRGPKSSFVDGFVDELLGWVESVVDRIATRLAGERPPVLNGDHWFEVGQSGRRSIYGRQSLEVAVFNLSTHLDSFAEIGHDLAAAAYTAGMLSDNNAEIFDSLDDVHKEMVIALASDVDSILAANRQRIRHADRVRAELTAVGQ